ncbi:MAG: methyl-accepting chemotaxis protein [Treponema sp.]|nr:methyl-accepting chemotaxis protein [Treponema sp.]
MNNNGKDTKKQKKGLLLKIAGTSSIFVLMAILVLSIISIISMQNLSMETALIMGNKKLSGDMAFFKYMITHEYGSLSLKGSELLDQDDNVINYQYEFIDRLSADIDVVATIFVYENNDFRRIATSITNDDGDRVVDTFLGSSSPAFAPIRAGQEFIGNVNILGNEYLAAYQPIFAQNNRDVIGLLFIGVEMSAISNTISYSINEQIIRMVIIAFVILLLSVLLNSLSCKIMLLKPINKAVVMLKEISEGEGDLTRQLIVSSKDEISDMAYYFNQTISKIKNLVTNIKKEAVGLSQIGNDLSNDMTETAAAMNEITANIESIKVRMINQSASVTETNATMEQITVNINKLNDHVEKQTTSVAQSSSSIEEMLANINSVTQTLIKNTENVDELTAASDVGRSGLQEVASDIQEIARESEGLLEINSVMENIASQTNLLSMNAAIEAAHAGDAGKGFAVVADEIRKLAESSSEQSKIISTVLKKIKYSIDKITASTDNVLNKFEAIDTGIKVVAEQEGNIRNAMEEQGLGSKQILEAISTVNETTQLVKSVSEEMLEGAKEVIREADNLEKATQEITGGINEMASGAVEVNTAINNINNLSTQNRESTNHLSREVSRFKIE